MQRMEQIVAKALAKTGHDRYRLSLAVAKRAAALADGAAPLIDLGADAKFADIALHEIAEDRLVLESLD